MILDFIAYFYAIALAIPPVFIVFWLLTEMLNFIGNYLSLIPVFAINILVGILTSVFAIFTFITLIKSIKSKFMEDKKQQERKEDVEQLTRSKELYQLGLYDISVLESSKVVESTIKRLLELRGVVTNKVDMYELVQLSGQHRILGNEDIKCLHEIRVKRNESIHMDTAIDKTAASRMISISRNLISKLDAISTGYEWLELNRNKVLKQLREGDVIKCRKALKMLYIAWKNRDGAVAVELSAFFEVALISNPQLILEIFKNDRELLESWLRYAEIQLFTDFLGGNVEHLKKVQTDILFSLNHFLDSTTNDSDIEIGNLILDVIKKSKVREID